MITTKFRLAIIAMCIIAIIALAWSVISALAETDYNSLGLAEYKAGNYEKATAYYNKAIESDLNNTSAYFNRGLVYLNTGSKYTPEGNTLLEQAISDFSRVIELTPDSAGAYYHRGLARIKFIHFYDNPFSRRQIKLFNEAVSDFNKALDLDNTFYLSYAGLGNAYDLFGKFDEAVEWYNMALENEKEIIHRWGSEVMAAIYYSRGRAYQRVENPKVIDDYLKSLEYDPDFNSTIGHLASIYLSMRKYNDALKLYNRSVKLKEQLPALGLFDFHTWDGRGQCYYELGEYRKAIDDLNRAIKVGKRPILPALFYLGKTYLAMGEKDTAVEYFKRIIAISSEAIEKIDNGEHVWLYPAENYALYNFRGLAFMELKQYEKALADFEKVVKFGPEFPRGHTFYRIEGLKNMGNAWLESGDNEKSKQYYEEALGIADKLGLQFTKDALLNEL